MALFFPRFGDKSRRESMLFSKRVFALILLLFLFFLGSCHTEAKKREAHFVRWVIDGDTVVLENGQKLRYAGINAPEIRHEDQPAEPFGYEALKFNIRLVKHKKVFLEWPKQRRDRYGRWLAYVFLRDGTFVQAELVKRGLAFVCYMPPNLKYYDFLLKLERKALRRGVGLWGGSYFCGEPYYIGDKRSRRFHRPACRYGRDVSRANRIIFHDMKKAFYEGYCPCRRCRPWPGK